MNKILVTDLDNTLWPWLDWAVPALDAMVDYLAKQTHYSQEEIIAAIGVIAQQKGTVEYAGFVQDSRLFKGYDVHALARGAKQAFSRKRNAGLQLYEGVAEILPCLVEMDIPLVALTDAPLAHATMRLRHFGLEEKFSLLIAVQDPEGTYLPEVEQKIIQGKYIPQIPFKRAIEPKPHTPLLQYLEAHFQRQINPTEVIIVGDNPVSDMGLAEKIGAQGLLAVYGRGEQHQELTERLCQYVAGRVAARNTALSPDTNGSTPIQSFRDVLKYVA
jgi:phosphoglycolate phosphatase